MERIANLIGVVVPFVGVIVAIGLLWNRAVDGVDLAILGAMYLLTAVGVTVGFHRLLTHRAFQTYPWLERTFAVLGSLSVQGSVSPSCTGAAMMEIRRRAPPRERRQ